MKQIKGFLSLASKLFSVDFERNERQNVAIGNNIRESTLSSH